MAKVLQNISEIDMINLLKSKDIRGAEMAYEKYGSYIYGVILEIIKVEDVAEIVLQDTFLKVWNKIEEFSVEKGRFTTWILSIARNTAIDMLRSKNYEQTLKLISLQSIPTAEDRSTTNMTVDHVDIKNIVGRLDPKYRSIIDLIYFKGYTQEEVAKELDIPLGTIKSRVRKAFVHLRNILEE